jgi:hypothetical protein
MIRRTLHVLAALVVTSAAVLAACGEGDPVAREVVDGGGMTTTSTPSTASTEDPSGEVAPFGSSHGFEWDSGLSVAVLGARVAHRSPYAAGGRASWPVVVVRVRLRNGTGERFDADLTEVGLRYGADGETAEQVFQDGVEELSGTIPPGGSATGSYAFSVPRGEADRLTVEVAPSWDAESATYSGAARR